MNVKRIILGKVPDAGGSNRAIKVNMEFNLKMTNFMTKNDIIVV